MSNAALIQQAIQILENRGIVNESQDNSELKNVLQDVYKQGLLTDSERKEVRKYAGAI